MSTEEISSERAINSGRGAVLASNVVSTLLPQSFHEVEGTINIEESERSGSILVNVELDRVLDLNRNGLTAQFGSVEQSDGVLHIECVVETKDHLPDLDIQFDMGE